MTFGEIPDVLPGATFAGYEEMVAVGVHRQLRAGMVGGPKSGTKSIVLGGGYPDDQDFGDEIIYTGFGGREGGRQVADQEWVGANEGMRVNLAHGLPVRVIRGSGGEPGFSPPSGYRYDGLYTVEEAWQERGVEGFIVCRFRLRRPESTPPAPHRGEPPRPPRRVVSTILRRVRDTAMTRRVKDLYDYTCQFCGVQLTLPGGTAYAEGAHIRPLGTPHDGDDVESNILCLCPNDHLLFDRGALVLTDELKIVTTETGDASRIVRTAEGHTIDLASVRYHRSIFGRRAP